MNLKKPVTTHVLAAAVLAALALGGCTNAEPAKDTLWAHGPAHALRWAV